MKKIFILSAVILAVLILATGATFVFAKDSSIFDFLFSKDQKEERIMKRMASLYPEILGDFKLYSHSVGKITKDKEVCQEIDETINKENLQIKGTFCARVTVGQYRNSENKSIFVHMMQITKGRDIPGINRLLGMTVASSDKLGNYNIFRPENHEIGWFPKNTSKMNVILTQEGVARSDPDGGETMLYQNKATGDNPVTQYFISKYPPVIEN